MQLNSLLSGDLPISLNEYLMNEPLPLAKIHHVVLTFLSHRSDVAIFGAQAVNVYVEDIRATQDVDVMALDAAALATSLCDHLHQELNIAARQRTVASGKGYRVYQSRKPKNRHLVDIRQVDELPPCSITDGLRVVQPAELIALKVISMTARRHTPKGLSDHADLMRLLIQFPEYRVDSGAVLDRLHQMDSDAAIRAQWKDLVAQKFRPNDNDEY